MKKKFSSFSSRFPALLASIRTSRSGPAGRSVLSSRFSRGFSLIELVVSMGIFAIISGVALSILFTSLRVSRKSEGMVVLKEQGDAVLSQMVRQIRFAKSLDTPASCTPSTATTSLTVTSLSDNGQTTFACTTGASSSITSNSASLIDTNAVTVTACSFVCSQPTIDDPPTIRLQFTLSTKNATSFAETTGSLPFQTSVTLRNYSR